MDDDYRERSAWQPLVKERQRIQVEGIIQGVGFRPFVYRLANDNDLSGFVRNDSSGVTIEVEGTPDRLQQFLSALQTEAPPLAFIESVRAECMALPANNDAGFRIESSRNERHGAARTLVSPDVATCPDCLRELHDPSDRRYHYPFTNCTNCGPRFTIIRGLPYDRPQTTMRAFPLCPACAAEYDDPGDRRFHAQPVACPDCGPQVALYEGSDLSQTLDGEAALRRTRQLLRDGAIVAIKGLGGYHLACDGRNEAAVQRLRATKGRPHKPLALMVADLETISNICCVSPPEQQLLSGARRPIVLLRRRQEGVGSLAVAGAVAPQQRFLGLMLPYTPLHALLFTPDAGEEVAPLLVMTSGNRRGEPIVKDDDEALSLLRPLVDAVLGHNRPIEVRCDDSVVRMAPTVDEALQSKVQMVRRARGYAPQPLPMAFTFPQPVLAVGAHLKNTFCLGQGRHATVSAHIGNLDSMTTLLAFSQSIDHFERLFDVQPQVVAHDLHPDYLSTRYALERDGVQHIAVQHHHAHIASVLAEHGLSGPVIGVAFDGSGYGPDDTVWGGEFLRADLAQYERLAHLTLCPMPGGEQAVHEPWRMAAAWLTTLYGDKWRGWPLPFCRELDEATWDVLQQMMARNLNCPPTSSTGRLFDAVAALLGLRREVSYEGQAAVELEALAYEAAGGDYRGYPFAIEGLQISPAPLFAAIVEDQRQCVAPALIAARFHNGLAHMVADVCERIGAQQGLGRVALSGGVFQNGLLLERTTRALQARGFEVYTNEQVPPNDGGVSLGQAAVAAARLAQMEA
jgi:hydrogenase maturation protein HypF